MGDDKIEMYRGRPSKAVPFTAIIAAAALLWNVGSFLVNTGNSVLNHLHSIDVRLTAIESYRGADSAAAGERVDRIDRIESRLERLERDRTEQHDGEGE